MNRAFKMFSDCVSSLRTAEKEYEMNPTDFNRNVMSSLQNKVDEWLVWINEQRDIETTRNVPPFIGKTRQQSYQGVTVDIVEQLKKNHSPEEIESFIRLVQES